MMKTLPIALALFFGCLIFNLQAQSVALSGMRTDNPDGFSFVVLKALTAGETIFFTDREYQPGTNNFNSGESVWTYTVPAGGHAVGVEVLISEVTNNNTTVSVSSGSAGTISPTTGMNLGNSGEDLYAFNASNPANPTGTITEIFSYIRAGGNTNANRNPANDGDCPCSVDFTAFTSNQDNIQYTGSTSNTTLASFTDASNWTTGNPTATNNPLSVAGFTNLQFGGTTFPVEWLSFEANVRNLTVELNWATASELNNDHFLIERSVDGEAYAEIGVVQGGGTTQEVQYYGFTDVSPEGGRNYYRIRQVDLDGAFSFSDAISVELTVEANQVRMYPNPVGDFVWIESAGGTLRIMSLNGQVIQTTTLQAGRSKIDLSGLNKGLYVAEVREENGARSFFRLQK